MDEINNTATHKLLLFDEDMATIKQEFLVSQPFDFKRTDAAWLGGSAKGLSYPYIVVEKHIPNDSVTQQDVLEFFKELVAKDLSEQCNESIYGGFGCGVDFFDFELKDQNNFSQQLSFMVLDPTISDIYWKTTNNGVKRFTRQQFIDVCKAGEKHKRQRINGFWQIKGKIAACTTYEELCEITSYEAEYEVLLEANKIVG